MSSDAGAFADGRWSEDELVVILFFVAVGVNARVGADDTAFAEVNFGAVVKEGTLADDDPIVDGEIVAVGELDSVIDCHAFAHFGEEVAAQHAAKADAQPVIETNGRAVEHHPEPKQGLGTGEAFFVHVGVVLGFQGDVARVERELQDVEWQLAGEGEVELAAMGTAKIELEELVAHDFCAALGGLVAGELFIEEGDPAAVELFGFGLGLGEAGRLLCGGGYGGFGHTPMTIHRRRRMRKLAMVRDRELTTLTAELQQ